MRRHYGKVHEDFFQQINGFYYYYKYNKYLKVKLKNVFFSETFSISFHEDVGNKLFDMYIL